MTDSTSLSALREQETVARNELLVWAFILDGLNPRATTFRAEVDALVSAVEARATFELRELLSETYEYAKAVEPDAQMNHLVQGYPAPPDAKILGERIRTALNRPTDVHLGG